MRSPDQHVFGRIQLTKSGGQVQVEAAPPLIESGTRCSRCLVDQIWQAVLPFASTGSHVGCSLRARRGDVTLSVLVRMQEMKGIRSEKREITVTWMQMCVVNAGIILMWRWEIIKSCRNEPELQPGGSKLGTQPRQLGKNLAGQMPGWYPC